MSDSDKPAGAANADGEPRDAPTAKPGGSVAERDGLLWVSLPTTAERTESARRCVLRHALVDESRPDAMPAEQSLSIEQAARVLEKVSQRTTPEDLRRPLASIGVDSVVELTQAQAKQLLAEVGSGMRVLTVELKIEPDWDDATVWSHLDAVIRLVEGVTPMEFVAGWWESDHVPACDPGWHDGRPRCSGDPARGPRRGPRHGGAR